MDCSTDIDLDVGDGTVVQTSPEPEPVWITVEAVHVEAW